MSKDQLSDLVRFLKPFGKETIELVLWLRAFVWDLYPKTNELIYDNYNAVSFGWSLSDRQGHVFSTIAVFRTNQNIHFGFYFGNLLADPKKILLGKGNQYRYILVAKKDEFPKAYIKKLLAEAYVNALIKVKDKTQIREGLTITKSISPNKRAKKKTPPKKKKK
jgi:hypothetical protein